jgi:nucleotide-binding universal stress UspA family protein
MKILLAVDDSPHSQAAVEAVAAQFPPEHTEVLVLHVIEPVALSAPPEMAAGYYPELKEQVQQARGWVGQVAEKLGAAGFQVSSAVEQGEPRGVIVDRATSWQADLIVLGSQGRKGLGRFLLGSVSEAVARHAPCSVEIVRLRAGH